MMLPGEEYVNRHCTQSNTPWVWVRWQQLANSMGFIIELLIVCQAALVTVAHPEISTQVTGQAMQDRSILRTLSDGQLVTDKAAPKISFQNMVCDLAEVGPGTKNICEFRFTNTGRGLLKIGNISRTCGCTVFHLDKKQYPPNETGVIKVIYTAAKSTTTRNVQSRL